MPGMMVFDGSHTSRKSGKTSRGKKKASGTSKQDLVKIARQERQERQRQKELNERARRIQAAWRATLVSRACKAAFRQQWDATVASDKSETGSLSSLLASPRFLATFLFFHSMEMDEQRRSIVCELVLGSVAPTAGPDGAKEGNTGLFTQFLCRCDPTVRRRHELLLQRLLCVCLDVVAAKFVAMQETRLLVCLTESATWHASGCGYSKVDASCLCWCFLCTLINSGDLLQLVATRCEQLVEQSEEQRAARTPSLVSILGLSLRPFALNLPEGQAYDQTECYQKFFSTVLSVPNLSETIPPATVAYLRRPHFWRAAVAILASRECTERYGADAGFPAGSAVLLKNVLDLGCMSLVKCTASHAAGFFKLLYRWIPAIFTASQTNSLELFEVRRNEDDDDVEPAAEDRGHIAAGGSSTAAGVGMKRPHAEVVGYVNRRHGVPSLAALTQQLSALLMPQTIAPLLEIAFAEREADPTALLYICGVAEWILRNSPEALTVGGPRLSLLNFVAFRSGKSAFLRQMWAALCSQGQVASLEKELLAQFRETYSGTPSAAAGASGGSRLTSEPMQLHRALLCVFCICYSHLLSVQDDEEFFVRQTPFTLKEVREMVAVVRDLAAALYLGGSPGNSADRTAKASNSGVPCGAQMSAALEDVAGTRHVLTAMSHLLRRLYTRDARRSFCENAQHWVYAGCSGVQAAHVVKAVVNVNDAQHDKWQRVLQHLPFAVPFSARAQIFHERVRLDREERAGLVDAQTQHGRWVRIRRNYLFEDALERLPLPGEGIKDRIRVQFVDEHGMEEAGIDGGGLFKEFMHELVKNSFGPTYALFKSTADTHLLYPNPSSDILGESHLEHFHFLGMVLGKALYEGVLVDLPLAGFFLSKLLSRHNYVDDLPSLDPELYRNLMVLKTYDGDVEDLGLNFAIVDNEFDETRETDLVPGGKDIVVNNDNRMQYINAVANYRLNTQIRRQSSAFLAGVRRVVRLSWFQVFSESELQKVISGTPGGLDIADLRAHTNYSGGYNDGHPVIDLFWKVLESMTAEQQTGLLQFATSSDRAPLLGFRYLNPTFCIHRGGAGDLDRLPSAATCMNLLKLPPYEDSAVMREKLAMAISANGSYGLS